jgi:hypothetical protein
MWMRAEGTVGFVAGDVPDWVKDWMSRRRPSGAGAKPDANEAKPKASIAASEVEATVAAFDPKAEARAAAARERNRVEREAAIRAGLDELDVWLSDQVERGVATFVAQKWPSMQADCAATGGRKGSRVGDSIGRYPWEALFAAGGNAFDGCRRRAGPDLSAG